MANPEYTEGGLDGDFASGLSMSKLTGWIGAACSLGLMAGLAWWGYDLVQRDAYGVPVIAKLEGEARVLPEQPGGFQAANQGLSVNELSARGDATPVEQVTLAPEPVDLTAEDQPIPKLRPNSQGLRDAVTHALEDAGVVPEASAPVVAPAVGPAEDYSNEPRPKPRPDFTVVTRRAEAPSSLSSVPLEIAFEDIPAGTRLVQLGAFASPEIARAQWDNAMERFGPFLAGKSRVIQRTENSGKVFYRLRVHGFSGLPDARRFCAALEAEKADCIPVLVR